ncbi:MAG: hypothetical protein ACUVUC_12515 [Thermoguttaceae bacterium]
MPEGFDFPAHMRRLCEDMVRRLPELWHIDLERVAVGVGRARSRGRHGLYASLTPMRFPGGSTETVRRGRRWGMQRLVDASGREILYILNFYLPRFMDLCLDEKLSTVLHELWHVGPHFDGDLRRFHGRCYAHSGSQKRYDAWVEGLARRWLSLNPPECVYGFLRYDFDGLMRRYGRVFGQRFTVPKLLPL